jgi:hypothetical protein
MGYNYCGYIIFICYNGYYNLEFLNVERNLNVGIVGFANFHWGLLMVSLNFWGSSLLLLQCALGSKPIDDIEVQTSKVFQFLEKVLPPYIKALMYIFQWSFDFVFCFVIKLFKFLLWIVVVQLGLHKVSHDSIMVEVFCFII